MSGASPTTRDLAFEAFLPSEKGDKKERVPESPGGARKWERPGLLSCMRWGAHHLARTLKILYKVLGELARKHNHRRGAYENMRQFAGDHVPGNPERRREEEPRGEVRARHSNRRKAAGRVMVKGADKPLGGDGKTRSYLGLAIRTRAWIRSSFMAKAVVRTGESIKRDCTRNSAGKRSKS